MRTTGASPAKSIHFLVFLVLMGFSGWSGLAQGSSPRGIVVLSAGEVPRSQREALLILPGFGAKDEGVDDLRKYFSHRGFDLFIPDYIGRDSIAQCTTSLDRFVREKKLGEYRKVHVFAYIIGGWTLNRWIQEHPHNNIFSIVYDRSPLQERAAYAAVQDMPFLTRLWFGKIVEEFSKTPYEPIPNDQKNIGIIMESTATNLVRKHKKTVLSIGALDWEVGGRNQAYDDYFYTLNNHDEMYHNLSAVGAQILYFFKNGKFTTEAARVRPDIDSF